VLPRVADGNTQRFGLPLAVLERRPQDWRHVLACEFQDALLRFDECSSIVIHIPQSAEFDEFDELSITEQNIDQIERQRPGSAGR
jgi:hypothetical protein